MTKNPILTQFEDYKRKSNPTLEEQRAWLLANIQRMDEKTKATLFNEIIPELTVEEFNFVEQRKAHEAQVKQHEVDVLQHAILTASEDRTDLRHIAHVGECAMFRQWGRSFLAAASLCLIAGFVAFFLVYLKASIALVLIAIPLALFAFNRLELAARPKPEIPILPAFHENEQFYSALSDRREVVSVIEIYFESSVDVPHAVVRIKSQIHRRLQEYFPECDTIPPQALTKVDALIQQDIPRLRAELRLNRLLIRPIKIQFEVKIEPPKQKVYYGTGSS